METAIPSRQWILLPHSSLALHPQNGAVDVSKNSNIEFTFNEKFDGYVIDRLFHSFR